MNLLSLLLGIAAIVFAVHSVQVRGCLACCTFSGLCCAGSLLCQLIDNDRISQLGDVAALLDTSHARVVCACVLLAVCTALNAAALIRSRRRQACNLC